MQPLNPYQGKAAASSKDSEFILKSHVALKVNPGKILRKFHIWGLKIVLFVHFAIEILDLFYDSFNKTLKETSEQLFP